MVAVPMILREVGASTYGMWATLSIFTGVGGFLDFGVPRSMIFCMGRPVTSGALSEAVFWTAVGIVTGTSILISLGAGVIVTVLVLGRAAGATFRQK